MDYYTDWWDRYGIAHTHASTVNQNIKKKKIPNTENTFHYWRITLLFFTFKILFIIEILFSFHPQLFWFCTIHTFNRHAALWVCIYCSLLNHLTNDFHFRCGFQNENRNNKNKKCATQRNFKSIEIKIKREIETHSFQFYTKQYKWL